MNLLGIDVGFAKERATTGIAYYMGGQFGVGRATSDWASRKLLIPDATIERCRSWRAAGSLIGCTIQPL